MSPFAASLLALALALVPVPAPVLGQLPEHVEIWPDGTLRERYEFTRTGAGGERVRHGSYASFFEDGTPESEGTYADGLRDGTWTFRWPNGERRSLGRFDAGARSGRWSFFTADGAKDEHESGVYRTYAELRADGSGLVGETLDKRKHGRWSYLRTGGGVLFEGSYDRGVPGGVWVLRHADGTPEPAWLTGTYEGARRTGDAPPPALVASAANRSELVASAGPWVPESELAALVEALALEGSREIGREIERRPRELFGLLAWRLARCDLALEAGDEEARRLHEALVAIAGGGWEWAPFGTDDAPARNRLTALRWGTAWELIRFDETLWERDFARKWIEPVDVKHTVLAAPPLPKTFTQPDPTDDERLSDGGGTFGGRFGGRQNLEAAGSSGTEAALRSGQDWLASQVELAASGPLVTWELHALLAFYGDGWAIGREPLGLALEPLLVRAVLTQDDRHRGRAEPPRYVLQRVLETLVLAEAAGCERLPAVRQALEWAVDDLLASQSDRGPWPRNVSDARGDAVTTATAFLALQSAAEAGFPNARLDVPRQRAIAWLEARIDPKTGSVPADEREPDGVHAEACATATTAFAFVLAGLTPETHPGLGRLFEWIGKHPPRLDRPDYLMHGTHVAYQAGGELWDHWNKAMKQVVIDGQVEDGSWRAAGPRDERTTTALMVRTLEVYFRYARVLPR